MLCEIGGSAKIGELMQKTALPTAAALRTLVVTDRGIANAGLHKSCIESLKSRGFDVEVYSDVVADPPEEVILKATAHARRLRVGSVVGLGGGSSMDTAKLVAYLSHPTCNQTLADIYGVGNCNGARLPLIQVPTTAGTGSEVTPISIVTTGQSEKKGIVSPILLPDWAVLDGELTLSVPSDVTAATGIDAMVHAIEAYTSRIKKNPLSDLLAREALSLLGSNIREACRNGNNKIARSNMLLGSTYAGMSFANAPVGAVHALAYPIGAMFHVPHGLSNMIMLP
jgi:alcohol dehydrogenase class IV